MAKQQKPAWVYLIAGLIIGLFVAFLVFLSQQDSGKINIKTAIENSAAAKDTREVRQNNQTAPGKPEFDFYKMLPELQVNVSPNLDINIGKKKAVPTPEPTTPQPSSAELYYLQVGAFSQFKSADQQKAGLVLQNWPTKVQQVRKDDGRSIYRILVGPYNDGSELNTAEQGLKRQGLKPIRQATKS